MGGVGARTAAVVVTTLLGLMTVAAQTATNSNDNFNLSETDKESETCMNGDKEGKCVSPTQCYDDLTMAVGRNIPEDAVSGCRRNLSCCTQPTSNPPRPPLLSSTLPLSNDNHEASCWSGDKKGLCLDPPQCYENHTIAVGGVIVEVRDGSDPLKFCGRDLWCCTYPDEENPEPPSPPPKPTNPPPINEKCMKVTDKCTWCVALYREGGDVFRGQSTASGLYCGGALVGPRVVLTAATCVRAVQHETVRARLPLGDQPDRFYTVVENITHPHYSSATHRNDFALLVLDADVTWKSSISRGACMDFRAPIQGVCQTVGFSQEEEIIMSPVAVYDGPCRKWRGGGSGAEVACASATEDQCEAVTGFPLLCPMGNDAQEGKAIAGVLRLPCEDNKVLLNKVQPHSDWLSRNLRQLGVTTDAYKP